jgi:uncharacterized protein YndB with AHSA1/START domain
MAPRGSSPKPEVATKPFVLVRELDAPRDVVWRAWTDPERLERWWGAKGYALTVARLDVRPGGVFLYRMHAPGGSEMWGKFTYREVAAPERMVFVLSFSDAEGRVVRNPFDAAWPLEWLHTITLAEKGGKTTLAMHVVGIPETDEERRAFEAGSASMKQGFGAVFDQLDGHLAHPGAPLAVAAPTEPEAEREIVLTRLLDAPRERVFEAWTDPARMPRWWGPNGFTTTVSEMDVRPGGAARYVMHGPDGTDYDNLVVYHEVVRPERLVYSHGSTADPAQFHVTVTFAEQSGKTLLTLRSLFPTKAARDAKAKFGAIEGGRQTLARLAGYLSPGAFPAARAPAAASDDRLVTITRVFDAPRERVFRAWTDPQTLVRWFAPHGCAVRFRAIDVRPGGEFHSCIRTPDGTECWCRGVYREVVAPSRLVFTMAVANERGDPVDPVDVGMDPEWPRETLVTVTLEDAAGKTRLTLHQTVRESLARRTGAHPSWLQMLDRMAEDIHLG